MKAIRLVASVLMLALSSSILTAAEPGKATSTDVAGLALLAPSGKVLYLPGDSYVEAVAVFNGKQLWQSKDATNPLLATADHVFAQVEVKGKHNQVKLVILEATTGETIRSSEVITFPDWVSVQRDYGLTFRSTARLDKNDVVFVWAARTFHDGGEPLPISGPDGKPYKDPNAKEAGGAVRVDIATGRISAEKDYKPKDTDFPSGLGTKTKSAGWSFWVEHLPSKGNGMPHSLEPRVLIAERDDGKASWKRPIASEIFLPPRP
jgi:hypothetical protein